MTFTEVRYLLTILVIFFLPGWAFLGVTQLWKRWDPFARWCLAAGIGIAFYPALFYFLKAVLPHFRLGTIKLLVLFVFLGVLVIFSFRKTWQEQIRFQRLEWVAIFVVLATVFTRVWMAHLYPYPAWSDSLHHALITELTAVQGTFPGTLEPYAPTALKMYHLGLYGITAVVKIMTRAPSHTALLWTAQVLNGLCGLGIYLVLDRKVGRIGALVGMLVAGLYSFQPAWYFNWGRFTQVASQTILLIAWIVTWEAIALWSGKSQGKRLEKAALFFASALLNAAVFFIHFRVAAYYLPLLGMTFLWEGYRAYRDKRAVAFLAGSLYLVLLAVIFILPALLEPLQSYIQGSKSIQPAASQTPVQDLINSYYSYSPNIIYSLGMQKWLTFLAAASILFCLLRRKGLGILIFLWLIFLWIEGNLFRINLPVLWFTNFSGIVIMFYLPFSLLIGMGSNSILNDIPFFRRETVSNATIAVLLFAGYLFSFQRVSGIEEFRQFVTPADAVAMNWINEHVPQDAVFAVNTYFWLPQVPHGTDAGFWIPYFTRRESTTSTMLADQGPAEFKQRIVALSQLAENLAGNPSSEAVAQLCQQGVGYVYIGARGDFSSPGLRADEIKSIPSVETLYEEGGVAIFKICE